MINLYMTIAHRVENKLYVSLWYISGTLIWMPMLYFIGNVMWNPPTGALTGINDTIFNWFYGHNVLGLWFTTGLLPIIYYIVPRETRTPLYSHFLSLIAFWGIALFYTGVGGHHLLWAPIPYWLKTIAVAESIGMILPVAAFMMNICLTMRGNWNRFFTSIPLRFVDHRLGRLHPGLLPGFAPGPAQHQPDHPLHPVRAGPRPPVAAVLRWLGDHGRHVLRPASVFNCEIYSRTLANIQYSLYVIGFTFFFGGLPAHRPGAGHTWLHQGLPVWSVLPGLRPYMALRAAGGALVVISFMLFTFNIFATVFAAGPSAALPCRLSKPCRWPSRHWPISRKEASYENDI